MKTKLLMATVLLTACASTAFAAGPQAAGTAQKRTFASEFNRQLTDTEKEVVPAAEAMPEDKFNFAPTQGDFKGVRTFALQVKHIAVANYALGAGILQGDRHQRLDDTGEHDLAGDRLRGLDHRLDVELRDRRPDGAMRIGCRILNELGMPLLELLAFSRVAGLIHASRSMRVANAATRLRARPCAAAFSAGGQTVTLAPR